MATNKFLLAILLGLAVVACGGGGDGSSAPGTYSISGTVATGSAHPPFLPGVTINLAGASTATTTTAADGNYSFTGLANGSYTVTPSLTGYAFTPAGTAVGVSGANISNANFTATAVATT